MHGDDANRSDTTGLRHIDAGGGGRDRIGSGEGRVGCQRPDRFDGVGRTHPLCQLEDAAGFTPRGVHIEQDPGHRRIGNGRIEHRADLAVGGETGRRIESERASGQGADHRNHSDAGRCIGHKSRRRGHEGGVRLGPADAIPQHREEDVEFGTGEQKRRPVQTGRQMRKLHISFLAVERRRAMRSVPTQARAGRAADHFQTPVPRRPPGRCRPRSRDPRLRRHSRWPRWLRNAT